MFFYYVRDGGTNNLIFSTWFLLSIIRHRTKFVVFSENAKSFKKIWIRIRSLLNYLLRNCLKNITNISLHWWVLLFCGSGLKRILLNSRNSKYSNFILFLINSRRAHLDDTYENNIKASFRGLKGMGGVAEINPGRSLCPLKLKL